MTSLTCCPAPMTAPWKSGTTKPKPVCRPWRATATMSAVCASIPVFRWSSVRVRMAPCVSGTGECWLVGLFLFTFLLWFLVLYARLHLPSTWRFKRFYVQKLLPNTSLQEQHFLYVYNLIHSLFSHSFLISSHIHINTHSLLLVPPIAPRPRWTMAWSVPGASLPPRTRTRSPLVMMKALWCWSWAMRSPWPVSTPTAVSLLRE